jgi:hypothetical protein
VKEGRKERSRNLQLQNNFNFQSHSMCVSSTTLSKVLSIIYRNRISNRCYACTRKSLFRYEIFKQTAVNYV